MAPTKGLSRRMTLGLGVAALFLAGCGRSEYIDFSTAEGVSATLSPIVERLEAARAGKGRMFALAVYRAAYAPQWRAPDDEFDPLQLLGVATERRDEPKAMSPEYFRALAEAGRTLEGMGVEAVVERYVAQDAGALKEQIEWIKGFDERVRIRLKSQEFEKKNREALIERLTPRQADYRWTSGQPRAPVIDFSMFNALDRSIEEVKFAVDLVRSDKTVVASSVLDFVFDTRLEPGASGQYMIKVGDLAGFSNKGFMDLRDPMVVGMKVVDAFVGEHESVLKTGGGDGKDEVRRRMLASLTAAVADSKMNLFKFRVVFTSK